MNLSSEKLVTLGAPAHLPDASVGPWYVLHTRARQEKVVAEDLVAMQVAHYLPLMKQVRHYGKRRVVTLQVLFTGYVFMRGEVEKAYELDRLGRIARIIQVDNQEQLDWELRNLHLALSQDAPLTPCPRLKKGVRVEVRSGPFRGLQGVVEAEAGDNRLILGVRMLSQGLTLELDDAVLEPIE